VLVPKIISDKERLSIAVTSCCESVSEILVDMKLNNRKFAIILWSDENEDMQIGSSSDNRELRNVTESLIIELHKDYEDEIH